MFLGMRYPWKLNSCAVIRVMLAPGGRKRSISSNVALSLGKGPMPVKLNGSQARNSSRSSASQAGFSLRKSNVHKMTWDVVVEPAMKSWDKS